MVMDTREIIEKLKTDIATKKTDYQQRLQKSGEEENLLNYMKGMLDITENNVSNFPYYDKLTEEDKTSEEQFNTMLKYTLKEDKIIASFKAEIKNLYFLEKIGYLHAEQYQEAIKKLEEYRLKIKESYLELEKNKNLKIQLEKQHKILNRLEQLEKVLSEKKEVKNIDDFYETLQYSNLSESEKTQVLFSVLEHNLNNQLQKLRTTNKYQSSGIERKIGKINPNNIEKIREAILKLQDKFSIKVTIPKQEKQQERFLFVIESR